MAQLQMCIDAAQRFILVRRPGASLSAFIVRARLKFPVGGADQQRALSAKQVYIQWELRLHCM